MHPDRMGKSKWVKLNHWYYTTKRQTSRHAAEREALRREDLDCVDCNQPADRERPLGVTQGGDVIVELVCRDHEVECSAQLD